MDLSLSLKDKTTLEKMATSLRFLCADMVQEANSGHPGVAMGLADVAVVLSHHVRLNPTNPKWLGRDRLVFSGGHASALVYALLHLWGFNVSLEDLKAFRQLHSLTPGHPEYKHTAGIEVTTGPLGQGFANAVGFAIAGKMAQDMLGNAFSHKVYCLCGDGDLQEGISYESASLAGHLGLADLIVIYDSNAITIEGDTNLAFSENVRLRFEAQGWAVLECKGHDFLDIDQALNQAQVSGKPTLIIAHTTIGKGASELEGSAKTHGAPLGAEVLKRAKEAAKWAHPPFYIPEEIKLHFSLQRGEAEEKLWTQALSQKTKEQIAHLQAKDFSKVAYPVFELGQKCATRASNGAILNAIAQSYLGFVGGSADLAPSNNTRLKERGDFLKGVCGRNLHFGIREHAMGAICNGISNYGLFVPFCATFFVFSDYLAPALRLSALMQNQVYYVFTHDSIGVGEDGATHQPIEHLSHLRAVPHFEVYRPMDAHENVLCWQVALKRGKSAAFVLSRQDLEVASCARLEQVQRGGYVLYKSTKEVQISLLSSGSEVVPCLKAASLLEEENIGVQVVSVPCFDLLLQQEQEYLNTLLVGVVLAVEASRGLEWFKFADEVLGMQSFGKSGKGADLFTYFGFSPENIASRARALL
ncbi:Transketolase TktA [Helicobacter sp. NHP19-003]|uniref:Transketolase n=1 Tax=Helicobacter gastrocanis TaxID=2849641 RepID=A0ABN6I372_9HELI|nr:transketolase [Helicobacter sp. NHP19-003]BCZ17993.1 Transketolase TktA [Helicobacter sp. NHP19-003]